jgi:UDP-3-O-[3-hydroxymyristoyl] N-acetylglucosamine deacetylase
LISFIGIVYLIKRGNIMLQKTINTTIRLKGIGLHSGVVSTLTLKPAPVNSGILFIRTDVEPEKTIEGLYYNVQNTMLTTALIKDNIEVKTIEHLYSALAGLSIDNLIIEIEGPEIPIMDGSSRPFIFAIQSAGIQLQTEKRKLVRVKKEISVTEDDKLATLKPYNGSKATFEIQYNNKMIDATPQIAVFDSSIDSYTHAISRARTFGFEKDIEALKKQNRILGGSLDNAILVNDDEILNADGLRLSDEFVRHKLLDAIGDLYLLGHQIIGEYYGFKSGHTLNNRLIRALMADKDAWEYTE